MQEWSNEMNMIVFMAFVIGIAIGYIILGLTKGSVKKFTQLEKEVKKLKAEREIKEEQLEMHFSESAELLSSMAQDYKKLYMHLAKNSKKLLSESQSIELFKQLQLQHNEEVIKEQEIQEEIVLDSTETKVEVDESVENSESTEKVKAEK